MFKPAWSVTPTPPPRRQGVSPHSQTQRRAVQSPPLVEPESAPSSPSSSIEHLPLHDPEAQPISPSILLNPLPAGCTASPPKSRANALLNKLGVGSDPSDSATNDSAPRIVGANGRRPSIVAQPVSIESEPPPEHFVNENPDLFTMSPPKGDIHSRSSSAVGIRSLPSPATEEDEFDVGGAAFSRRNTSCSRDAKLRFAELPPGRRMYRSNSLSIGVAARARMISNQGGGSSRPSNPQAALRYAGPQQWYQTGGQMPSDVYTYKDVSKGISKLWGKVRKRSTSEVSSTSSEAKSMEAEAKGKTKEIEHIEETDESDHVDADGRIVHVEEEEPEEEEEEEEERGRPSGLAMALREGSITSASTNGTDDVPKTPEDGDSLELSKSDDTSRFTKEQKGKATARHNSRLTPTIA